MQQTADQEEENGDAEDGLFPDTSIDLQLTREGKVSSNLQVVRVELTLFCFSPVVSVCTSNLMI